MAALDACLASSCETECTLTCGGSQQFAPSGSGVAAACTKCINAAACSEHEKCARDPDCNALRYCGHSCVTLFDCRQACRAAHDAGAGEFTAFAALAFGHCTTDCAYGNDWRCVGHVTWPTAKGSSTVISMQTGWYGGPPPFPAALAGITMKLCDGQNQTACSPLDQAPTAADGTATLTLLQQPGLPPGPTYFEYSASNIVPEIIFQGFPFSERVATFGGIAVGDPSLFDALVASAGVTPDPSRGLLSMGAIDCFGNPSPGVSFTVTGVDDKSTMAYYSNGAFTTQVHETDAHGQGVVLNVPPGTVTITATPKALGRPSSVVAVPVRAGAATFANMPPQPP
jgi:hypothetical protein